MSEETAKRKRDDSQSLPDAKKRKIEVESGSEDVPLLKEFVPKTNFENSDEQLGTHGKIYFHST